LPGGNFPDCVPLLLKFQNVSGGCSGKVPPCPANCGAGTMNLTATVTEA
jgi:hypothetical protein